MILVLSLELVKTYRVFFLFVDALRSFRVSWEGHICAPLPLGREKVAQRLRPPAVRGLNDLSRN